MITLLHIYPDLLNLYGDWANLSALASALAAMGAGAQIKSVPFRENIDLSSADFVFIGSGTEKRLALAANALAPFAKDFIAALDSGVPMLFSGPSAVLAAGKITLPDGEALPGLALAKAEAHITPNRQTGDGIYTSSLSDKPLVGYINKSAWLEKVEKPAFMVVFGPGGIRAEGKDTKTEGIFDGGLLATCLTGPVLVKNPWLRDYFAKKIFSRACPEATPAPLPPGWAEKSYEVTVTELRKRMDSER